MSQEKYIGLDVHDTTISAAVKNAEGKVLIECVLETKAATILEFIQGRRGTLGVTFEEGTLAAWLYDLLKPHVSRLVVCSLCWITIGHTLTQMRAPCTVYPQMIYDLKSRVARAS